MEKGARWSLSSLDPLGTQAEQDDFPGGIAFPADLSSCQMQVSQGREETILTFLFLFTINTVNSDMLETESA